MSVAAQIALHGRPTACTLIGRLTGATTHAPRPRSPARSHTTATTDRAAARRYEARSLGLDDHEYREVDRGRSIGGEHPRTVIRTAQAVLAGDGEPGAMSRGHELLHKAAELGRGEAMAMAELQGLGRPSSAHDPELLERLGWSRPYAQRILSHLEAKGLLRSMPERSDQPGRPRKLYEPNPNPNSNPELK